MVRRVISLATLSNIISFVVRTPSLVCGDTCLIFVKRGSVSHNLEECVLILTLLPRK